MGESNKAECHCCQKNYLKENMMQVDPGGRTRHIFWLCLRCFNLEKERIEKWNKAA